MPTPKQMNILRKNFHESFHDEITAVYEQINELIVLEQEKQITKYDLENNLRALQWLSRTFRENLQVYTMAAKIRGLRK
jgi:hypothetical protein